MQEDYRCLKRLWEIHQSTIFSGEAAHSKKFFLVLQFLTLRAKSFPLAKAWDPVVL